MRSTLEQKAIFRHQVDTIQQFLFNTRPTLVGQIAQLVEQRIENPRVGGSIPSLATIILNKIKYFTKTDCRQIPWHTRSTLLSKDLLCLRHNFCHLRAHFLLWLTASHSYRQSSLCTAELAAENGSVATSSKMAIGIA